MISSYLVVFKHIAIKLLIVGAVLGLVACGGDDDKKTPTPTVEPTQAPTPAPDTTPADFTLSLPQATYAPGAVATTTAVTITDIDTLTDISISAGGEYSIDSGSFTSSAGQIANEQTLVARATAGSGFSDEVEITVTVGTVERSFTVETEAQDTLPEDFAPAAAETGVLLNTDVTFPEFTLAGITGEVAMSIAGGVYSLNSGDFVGTATTVSAGDTVSVRVTASSEFSTTTSATLTIGAGEGVFSVETEVEDVNPDAFELGDNATVSVPGVTAESQIITVTGINSPANISILNGDYRIEGVQDYGNTSSTVAPGQQVQVRVAAGSAINMTETATLTIGDQSDTFGVTATDQTPPTAEVVFPTANTMSDGSFVTLRGKASDDFGPVTQIQVIVTTDDGAVEVDNETITAGTGEDFQDTWSVQVDLASETLNTLQVIATDAGGNTQETPVTLTVLQKADALVSLFPEDNEVLIGFSRYSGLEWDREANRLFIPRFGPEQMLAIDVATGTRSVFIDDDPVFESLTMLQVVTEQNRLLFTDQNKGIIFNASLDPADAGTFEVLTDATKTDSNVEIGAPYAMEVGSDGALYVADAAGHFYSVDMGSGTRTLISDSTRPVTGENPFINPVGLVLDETNNRALISDYTAHQLLDVNLTSGARAVFVASTELETPYDMKLDADDNRIILSETNMEALLAVDLESKTVTTLSDSTMPVGGANSLQTPWGIVIDGEDDIAFVVSQSQVNEYYTAIILVDLTTGERIVVSATNLL